MLLYVVSPAKTLDLETPVPRAIEQRATEPLFLDDAAKLATTMRRKSARQVAALMDLSPALSELNVQRYRDYAPGLIGLAPYSYAPQGEAYIVYFEHLAEDASAREVVRLSTTVPVSTHWSGQFSR